MKYYFGYVKDHVVLVVAVVLLCLCFLWVLVNKIVSPGREEQINFAIISFSHHDEGKKEEFESLLKQNGIKEVNLSYFDITDTVGATEYLLTYGYKMSDFFILGTNLGQSVLTDCFYTFSDEQIKELNQIAGFDLKYVTEGNNVIGVLIHESGNDSYNEHFSFLNQWLLFEADNQDFDYAVFFNIDSAHNKTGNFSLLKHVIQGV